MSEDDIGRAERRLHVNRWRGLSASVLAELDEVDLFAESRGCRFSAQRVEARASRARCLELREQLGLGVMDKLRRGI